MALNDALNNELDDQDLNKQKKPYASIGLDGGEIYTGVLDTPISEDWSPILRSFGLDPEVFEVVGDQVKMSKWQQSKRTESGDRDIVWLYAYKAVFRRKLGPTVSPEDVQNLRKVVQNWKFAKPVKKETTEPATTFVVNWADWQLFKSAGGGVDATIERVLESFDKTVQRFKELQRAGRNIEQIALVNMGDPIEGCTGHYPSQEFSVQGTQRQQLLLALDLWSLGVRTLASLAPKAIFISTLSNHGEWQRRNGKNFTTDSDSADGFLADTLKRIFEGTDHINDWVIPHDEMCIQKELSGVPVAFTHGHKVSGKEIEWLRGQSIKLLRDYGKEPKLWVTAHKHHVKVDDMGMWWRFQCPSLDGGSKWFEDIAGMWSTPGTLTFLVGLHDKNHWSDMSVL
ncbi:hypothetical protein UFOVP772_14 [uncultured Caudovirales phage]|uniref:Uncharacterized protein n=1 Tax=uncultured Caudovirales phage TaxID=2100421 RepID=A0A6J5NPQ9_9CAUD|nr:hypothetical protein UFOVP772_14 [uncultured Caudovirales phage]